jgi:hypothetical protein
LLEFAFDGVLRGEDDFGEVPGHVELRRSASWAGLGQARAAFPAEARTIWALALTAVASHPAHFLTNSMAVERISLVRSVALMRSPRLQQFLRVAPSCLEVDRGGDALVRLCRHNRSDDCTQMGRQRRSPVEDRCEILL